jgi:hypothetical protein
VNFITPKLIINNTSIKTRAAIVVWVVLACVLSKQVLNRRVF